MTKTDWKKAYTDMAKKYFDADKDLDVAYEILTSVLECGSMDLSCIFKMERDHEGTIQRAVDLKDELDCMNFGNFVMAVKDVSLDEVRDELEEYGLDKHIGSLEDMIIDDNYCAWGGIYSYGYYEEANKEKNHYFQELFADFIVGGSTKDEFLTAVRKLFKIKLI